MVVALLDVLACILSRIAEYQASRVFFPLVKKEYFLFVWVIIKNSAKKRKLVIRSDLGEASENLNYRPICHSQLVDWCVAIYRPLATIESIWLLLSEEQKIIKLLFLLPLFLLHF